MFLVVVIWACAVSLQDYDLAGHVEVSELSLLHGAGVVVGGWVVGTTILSDYSRFARSKRQAVSIVLLPRCGSITAYMLVGVLLAQAHGTDDIIAVMGESIGMGAVVVVVAGEMVINCSNIYSATLAMVSFFDMAFGWRIPRPLLTLVRLSRGGFSLQGRHPSPGQFVKNPWKNQV